MATMTYNRPRKSSSGERGQAILELLPVIGLMLMLIFGVIDFSRAVYQLEVITALTREGSNLASRNVSLQNTANAVLSDGAALNLSTLGEVIVTSVESQTNPAGKNQRYIITGQVIVGGLTNASRIGSMGPGNGNGNKRATLPVTTPQLPLPNQTLYITEVFSTYSPITPIGSFIKVAVPSTLYDVAYF